MDPCCANHGVSAPHAKLRALVVYGETAGRLALQGTFSAVLDLLVTWRDEAYLSRRRSRT